MAAAIFRQEEQHTDQQRIIAKVNKRTIAHCEAVSVGDRIGRIIG